MSANAKRFTTDVDLAGNKLLHVAAGTSSTDGANVGQLPALPLAVVNGGTGGDVNPIAIVGGCISAGVPQNSVRYAPPYFASVFATSAPSQRLRVLRACRLQNLYVDVASAPAAGQMYVFTVLVNGAVPGAAPSVTINAGAVSGSDLVNTAVLAAGDQIELRITTSPLSGATGAIAWSAELVATP